MTNEAAGRKRQLQLLESRATGSPCAVWPGWAYADLGFGIDSQPTFHGALAFMRHSAHIANWPGLS